MFGFTIVLDKAQRLLFAPQIDLTADTDEGIHLLVDHTVAGAYLNAKTDARLRSDDGLRDDRRRLHLWQMQPQAVEVWAKA